MANWRSEGCTTRRTLLASAVCTALPRTCFAAVKWIEKKPLEWNPQDLQTILNHSAWVHEVPLQIDKTGAPSARRSKGGEARDAEFTLLVRWESGLPIRLAHRNGVPPEDVPDRYILSVSRVPLQFLGAYSGLKRGEEMSKEEVAAQFAATALLERGGKGPIRAEKAQWITSEFSPRVDILFPRDPNRIQPEDVEVAVSARIGVFTFNTRFALKPMTYLGKLEL